MESNDEKKQIDYQEIQVEIKSKNEDNSTNHKEIEAVEFQSERSYEVVQLEPKSEVIDFNKDFYILNCPYCKAKVTTQMVRKPGKFV